MNLLPGLCLAFLLSLQGEPLPRDLTGWIDRQDRQLQRGESERALAEARGRVEKEPGSPEPLFLLGRILGNTGDVDGARARFQAAVDLAPDYAPGWQGMARVHLLEKKYDVAVREARRAYDLDTSAENRILLVNALYFSGDRPGAYRILKEALAKAPGDNALRFVYATFLFEEGFLREAEREARLVLAGDVDHEAGRQMLVAILADTGRSDEAAAECREVIRRSPKDFRPRLLLRRLLLVQENYAAASAVVEDLLKMEIPAELRVDLEKDLKTLRQAAAPKEPGEIPPPIDGAEVRRRLEGKDVEVRRETLRMLLAAGLDFLPPPVLLRIQDEDETVRRLAVRLVGQSGDASHLTLLSVILYRAKEREPSLSVRLQAFQAIGRIASPAGLLLLAQGIREPEPEAVAAVLGAVRDITGKRLVPDPDAGIPEADLDTARGRFAKWWFEDPTAKVWRRKAAAAVAEGGDRDLAWYLVPWVEEEDPAMRAGMLDAMARLSGDPSFRDLPTGTKEERAAARERALAFLSAGGRK